MLVLAILVEITNSLQEKKISYYTSTPGIKTSNTVGYGTNSRNQSSPQPNATNFGNPIELTAAAYKAIAKTQDAKNIFQNAQKNGFYDYIGLKHILVRPHPSYLCISADKVPIQITKNIGQGGFARVVIARVGASGEEKALKYIRYDPAIAPLIIREINFLGCLRKTKYIAKMDTCMVVTYKNNSKDVIIVMPIFKRDALDLVFNNSETDRTHKHTDHARHITSTKEFKLEFLKKIARGIEEIHERKIIHRDIKLENILLDDNHSPYISDLGLAIFLEDADNAKVAGTPLYMAPEIEHEHFSFKTDIFALGIVFYSVIHDRAPEYFVKMAPANRYNKVFSDVGFPEEFKFMRFLINSMLMPSPKFRPNIKDVLCYLESEGRNPIKCLNKYNLRRADPVLTLLTADEQIALKSLEEQLYLNYAMKTNKDLQRYAGLYTDSNNQYNKIAAKHKQMNIVDQSFKAQQAYAQRVIL